jgi:site-specific DNA recombinase
MTTHKQAALRVALYVRVSTSRQVQHQTIEQQLERLHAHVRAQAAWACREAHVFRDDGYTGAALARPGLDRLRDAVKAREVDRVVVTAPDRFARNYVHQMVLLEEFARAGCAVEFLDRPMSDDPHDQLLLQIRGAVAEYERTLIGERMRRGRLSKLQAGLLLPWTRPPYGYRLAPDRPRDPRGVSADPAEGAVVAELFARYLEPGMSLGALAKWLTARGVPTRFGGPTWCSPSVRGLLRNPAYTGQLYAHRTRYRAAQIRRSATHPIGRPQGSATPLPPEAWVYVGQIPALVSQAQFDAVQAKLAQNRGFARRHNMAHDYLLRCLVSCGRCGLACVARASNQRDHYYLCTGKQQSVHSHRATRCPARYTPVRPLDALVWADVCALLSAPEHLAAALARAHGGAWLPQELTARRENLRKGQGHLRQQLDRLTEAYLRAVIPLDEYERRRGDLAQRAQALEAQEIQLRGEAEQQEHLAAVTASLEVFRLRVASGLADAAFAQRRALVELLIDRVIVTDTDVEIRYVLPTSPDSEHVRFCHLRKDYFHDPAQRQDLEAALPRRLVHQREDDVQHRPHPRADRAVVPGVGQHARQAREAVAQLRQHEFRAVAVLNARRVHDRREHQPEGVYDEVALAPLDLLAGVEALGPPLSVVFTDCESMIARLGVRSFPAHTRTSSRSRPLSCSSVPFLRHRRKCSQTTSHGGKSCGSARQLPPLRAR